MTGQDDLMNERHCIASHCIEWCSITLLMLDIVQVLYLSVGIRNYMNMIAPEIEMNIHCHPTARSF